MIPALSLWQPWACPVMTECPPELLNTVLTYDTTTLPAGRLPPESHFGVKPIENRGWYTAYRGPLIIHAGLKWDPTAATTVARALGWPRTWTLDPEHEELANLQGCFLGVVDLVDVCERTTDDGIEAHACACGPFAFDGQCHWRLANPRLFPAPIAGRGRQRLWSPTEPGVQQAALELIGVPA